MKNNTKEVTRILLVLTLSLLLISLVAAQFPQPPIIPTEPISLPEPVLPKSLIQNQPTYFYQYYMEDPAMQYGFEPDMCNKSGMDFIVQIMPDACTPAPVRSDLLEEQNVPVFCRLTGIKINPLIQVPYIERIEAMTELRSPEIFSVTYHPPKSALSFMSYMPPQNKNQLEGVPTMSNLGYLVIFLKRQPQESKMPDQVILEESLRLTYNVARTFGISQNSFVLSEITHEEWQDQYKKYSFWNGKGYLKLEEIQNNKAKISIYKNTQQKIGSVTLAEGQRSDEIKLPGFYCVAGVELQVDEITTPKVRARMLVNGEEVLLGREENILDTECQIKDVYPVPGAFTGIVEIRCRNKRYTLELKNLKAFFSVQGQQQDDFVEKSIGDDLGSSEKHVYIGYIGKEKVEGGVSSFIMVFKKDNEKEIKPKDKNKIINTINDIIKDKRDSGKEIPQTIDNEINIILEKARIKGIKTQRINYEESINEFTLKKTTGLVEATYSSEIEDAFKEAIEEYEHVADVYSLVPNQDGTIYGIKALDAAARLAGKFNKKETQAKLLMEMIDKFMGVEANVSGDIDKAKKDLVNLLSSDPSKSSTTISTDQGNYRITLLSIEKPSLASQSVFIDVDGEERVYSLYEEVEDGWRIEEVQETQITLKCIIPNCGTETNKIYYGKTYNLGINRDFDTIDSTLTLEQIDLIKEVKVTILPFEARRRTTTNFTIQIGIEKRAIKLNPEKTDERIQKLDSLITKVEGFRDGLGKVVSIWKKACLVGGTALWTKNFIQGLSGESLARKKVMDYWGDWCSDKKNQQSVGASTISGCYKAKQEEINSDVDKTKTAIQKTNQFIKEVKSKPGVMKKSGFLGLGSSIDEKVFYREATLLAKSKEYNGIIEGMGIGEGEEQMKELNFTKLRQYGILGTEDVKEAIFNLNMQESCKNNEVTNILCDKIEVVNQDLFTLYKDYLEAVKIENEAKLALGKVGIDYIPSVNFPGTVSIDVPKVFIYNENKVDFDNSLEEYKKEETKLVTFRGKGFIVLAAVKKVGDNDYAIEKATPVDINNGVFTKISLTDGSNEEIRFNELLGQITKIHEKDLTLCRNHAIAEEYQEIKFWESGPYKGMVALMPISTTEGFYVGTKGYTGFEGALVAYPEISGNINTYTIGNVGPDNKIDFDFTTGQKKEGSDDCVSTISLIQGAEINVVGVLDSKARELDKKAKSCIQEAIKSYNRGDRIIKTGRCGNFKLGKPPSVRPTAQCEDFMSPQDCWMMYNLCDPVMCPASRCDLGGNYPVDNVFSTGIVGSLMLCWPNFENGKGVLVPICLTGVHRGLDDLAVTLKLARDCLEENKNTGKMTGICDQILSIYLCDFLWQNLDPLIKVGIPSLTQSLTNRGGGEYALFSESWKNSIDSIDYFTQYYGINTFKAFKERSTKQIGTEVCKRFISVAYPTQAKFWEEISKPESPTTFFATLQELEGVAGTQSHYKIYYQIYAGQDQGVAYRIYLKSPPSPGYYIIPDRYYVPNGYGYLAAGEYTGKSPDFIAPTGYKEICVDINGQEHCGFGQVTTNFAIDELQNLYLKEQLEKQVTSTKDCISGAPSFIPALTLNLQSAIKTTIEPAIYKRGIMRICSSGDPGAGVDEDRYKLVGYCDNKQVGCWLDMHSVNDSISDLGIRANIAQQAETKEINQFMDEYGLDNPDESRSQLTNAEKLITEEGGINEQVIELEKTIKDQIDKEEIIKVKGKDELIDEIEDLMIEFQKIGDNCIYDSEKARADYNIALLYEYIARIAAAEEIARTDKEIQETSKIEIGTGVPGITEEILPFNIWPVSGYYIPIYVRIAQTSTYYIEIFTEKDDNVKPVAPGIVKEVGKNTETRIDGWGGINSIGKWNDPINLLMPGFGMFLPRINSNEYGYVVIEHASNLYTVYENLEPNMIGVSEGEKVGENGKNILGITKNFDRKIMSSNPSILKGEDTWSQVGRSFENFFLSIKGEKFGMLRFRVFTLDLNKAKDPLCFFSRDIIYKINGENPGWRKLNLLSYYDSERCKEQRGEIGEIEIPFTDITPNEKLEDAIIIIDPGHGGTDSGAMGVCEIDEREVNLGISKELKNFLNGKTRQVFLTREDEKSPPQGRVRLANNKNADLFVSIHANSGGTSVGGAEVWINCEECTDSFEYRLDIGYLQCKIDKCKDNSLNYKLSKKLASLILNEIRNKGREISGKGLNEWDNKKSTYIKDADMPAVLVEAGFLSNQEECEFLKSTEGQKKIAEAVYDAVIEYYKYKAEEKVEEKPNCASYNEDNCETHFGCWWDQGWWFTGGCRECPSSCEGESKTFADLKFGAPQLCEETAKRQCGLDCEWAEIRPHIFECISLTPEKRLENMIEELKQFYTQNLVTIETTGASEQELENYQDTLDEAKSKINEIKQFITSNSLGTPKDIITIESFVNKKIDEINKILFGGNVIIVSQDNQGEYTTDNKIISYSQFPKICAILKQNNKYFNNDLAGQTEVNNQEIDSLGNNVQIRWYKIKALRHHKEGGFSGPFPTITDNLLGQDDEDYYWYQNIGIGSADAKAFWSQEKDTIQYSNLEIKDTDDEWCIDLEDDFGTYRFRAEMIVDGETFSSLGRPASAPEVTTMGDYNEIYSNVNIKELIVEPVAYDFDNGGIEEDVHRISIRSNYKENHENYVSRYGTTDNEMLFMEYTEAHKGIVWLWGANEWQQKEFIGMDCADIVVDSINKMIDDNILNTPKLLYGTTANWLANNKKINDKIYYFDYTKGEFYEVSDPENKIEIPITSTKEAVHVGDLFLLTKGYPIEEYPCYHSLIFYEDAGTPGILDKDDIFVYIGHAGLTQISYFALLEPLTTLKGIYFIRARLDELNQ